LPYSRLHFRQHGTVIKLLGRGLEKKHSGGA
jgi:hypothetical protein